MKWISLIKALQDPKFSITNLLHDHVKMLHPLRYNFNKGRTCVGVCVLAIF